MLTKGMACLLALSITTPVTFCWAKTVLEKTIIKTKNFTALNY
jgi:hypothetical protein